MKKIKKKYLAISLLTCVFLMHGLGRINTMAQNNSTFDVEKELSKFVNDSEYAETFKKHPEYVDKLKQQLKKLSQELK